jgi:glucose-1-phosphate cytidylyltransferase
MHVMILCGGYGTRLAGANGESPKPMVPIGGKPILWHIMKGFAHADFKDFILCLGYRSDVVKQYFLNLAMMTNDVTVDMSNRAVSIVQDAERVDWRITLAETGHDSMTGHRVWLATRHLPDSDDLFAVTYGDGVSDVDFRDVVRFHRAHGRLATVTAVHPPGRFGELALGAAGQVREFNEKPQVSAGWISGGFFVFSRRALDYFPSNPDLMLERGPLQRLARDGELRAYQHEGFWFCIDTPRDYQQLSEMWAARRAPWAIWQQTPVL